MCFGEFQRPFCSVSHVGFTWYFLSYGECCVNGVLIQRVLVIKCYLEINSKFLCDFPVL